MEMVVTSMLFKKRGLATYQSGNASTLIDYVQDRKANSKFVKNVFHSTGYLYAT